MDIAFAAGYHSHQAFTDVFRSMYKCSPTAFRVRGLFYPLQLPFVPLERRAQSKIEVRRAEKTDAPAWVNLSRTLVEGYPMLETERFRYVLDAVLTEGNGFVAWSGAHLIGAIAYAPAQEEITFWSVHPQFQRDGVAQLLLDALRKAQGLETQISITTFRLGDRADTGHRARLMRRGFRPADELITFGYPTQRLVLNLEKR